MFRKPVHVLLSVILTLSLSLPLTGCLNSAPEVSGAVKIASGQMSQLTAAEILALFNTAKQFRPDIPFDLTQAQAEGISAFLKANNINTIEQLEGIAEQFINDPRSVQLPPGLLEVFLADYENPSPTERTTNQGGGSLLSAATKLSSGQISEWTPDEVQVLGDTLTQLAAENGDPVEGLEYTDPQAAAIVDFLQMNDINTLEDWDDVKSQYDQDPNSVAIPEGALELFSEL